MTLFDNRETITQQAEVVVEFTLAASLTWERA